MTYEILFTTITGSHIWGMDTLESDIDKTNVYLAPTKDILIGTATKIRNTITDKLDEKYIELGPLTNNLSKCEITSLITVMSPWPTWAKDSYFKDLRKIVKDNLSKDCFHSIMGLASHNYKKTTSDSQKDQKMINIACRSLVFGTKILNTNKIEFSPYYGTREDIPELMERMNDAYQKSSLPAHSSTKPYKDFLLDLRLKQLTGNL